MKTPPIPLLGAFLLFGYLLTESDAQEEPHRSRQLLGKPRCLEVVATIESVLMSGRLLGFATTFENTSSTDAYTLTFSKMVDPLGLTLWFRNYLVGTEDLSDAIWHGGEVCVHLLPRQRFVSYLPLSSMAMGLSELLPPDAHLSAEPTCVVSKGIVFRTFDAPLAFFSRIKNQLVLAPSLAAQSDLPAPTSQILKPEYGGSSKIENNPLGKKQIGSLEITASLFRWNGRSSGLCLHFSKPPDLSMVRLVTKDSPELAVEVSDGRILHLSSPEMRTPTGVPDMVETLDYHGTELFIPFGLYDWESARKHGVMRLIGITCRIEVKEWQSDKPSEVTEAAVGSLSFEPLDLSEAAIDFDTPPMPEGSALIPFSSFLYPWWPKAGP